MVNKFDKFLEEIKRSNVESINMVKSEFGVFLGITLSKYYKKDDLEELINIFINEIIILIYEINFNEIVYKKSYLKMCIYNKIMKRVSEDIKFKELVNLDCIMGIGVFDKYNLENDKMKEIEVTIAEYLTKDEFELFYFRFIERRSIRELCLLYKIKESTIYRRIKRIKRKLNENKNVKEKLFEILK